VSTPLSLLRADRPIENLTQWLIDRAHRRYGLSAPQQDVTDAWAALAASAYAEDLGLQVRSDPDSDKDVCMSFEASNTSLF
jgi:hypothetical protein